MIYPENYPYDIILASASPRRHQLLEGLGFKFKVQPKNAEEVFPDTLKREEVALFLANLKADTFTDEEIGDKGMLITADTIVWLNEKEIGKPVDREDAARMLGKLSGNTHEVITAVVLRTKNKRKDFYACSKVHFRELNSGEIDYYLDNYQPMDKAGSYGIQEWIGYVAIDSIEGSFYNVMGLPTQRLFDELMKFIPNEDKR